RRRRTARRAPSPVHGTVHPRCWRHVPGRRITDQRAIGDGHDVGRRRSPELVGLGADGRRFPVRLAADRHRRRRLDQLPRIPHRADPGRRTDVRGAARAALRPRRDRRNRLPPLPRRAPRSAEHADVLDPSRKDAVMKAAVVTDFRSPLEIQDRPIPEPGPGQVLVRMEASGLCHTDIHAAHGDWPVRPRPPFVPGHEGIGRIEKFGPGVTGRAVGERVAIAWLGYACGHCRHCIAGWETLCESQQNSGYSVDGALAEYAVAWADFAAPVPDAVSSADAAPLTCAGVTTYKAVRVAGVAPAETVAVFGVGGLGHLALQYARIAGGIVIGVDIEDAKLAM